MVTLKEKQAKVLKETIELYNKNNRAIVKGRCVYTPGPAGNACAVGRLCSSAMQTQLEDTAEKSENAQEGSVNNPDLFNILPKRVKDLGLEFLLDLQSLHDTNWYWDDDGLSYEGKRFVESIKVKHGI